MARKRGLDHDDVINAGFTVIDRDGVERVSLRAVADLLDVQPPSLYSLSLIHISEPTRRM